MVTFTYQLENGRPIIPVTIRQQIFEGDEPVDGELAEASVRALVDTGAMGCVLSPQLIEATKLKFVYDTWHTTLGSEPSTVQCHSGTVEFGPKGEVEIGGIVFVSAEMPEGIDAILGMPFIGYGNWFFGADGTFKVTIGE